MIMLKRRFKNLAVLTSVLGTLSPLFVQLDATDFTDGLHKGIFNILEIM